MLKRTHILFIALCALCATQALPAQIMFGDVDPDLVLYDSSDPFGIITATNAIALSRAATNTAHAANALGVIATNEAAQAFSLGVSATNVAANAVSLSATATNTAQSAFDTAQAAVSLADIATNQSALATEAAQSVTNTAAVALALSASATNTAATALALGVTATNLSSTANTISVTATNRSEMALALAITATNTATQASAFADISYLYATNAAAQVATVYPASTNAAAVSAAALTRANLAYSLAASVNALATNALDVATNAAEQVATAYPVATNALGIATNAMILATNASAQVATAYPVATNAASVGSAAYIAATNALSAVASLAVSKADVTALDDYTTWESFGVFSGIAIDALNVAEEAMANTAAGAAATNALALLRVTRLWDAADTNVFVEVEGGTNVVVRRIMGDAPVTNYTVTFSAGFASVIEGVTNTPSGSIVAFPFLENNWYGDFGDGFLTIAYEYPSPVSIWASSDDTTFPSLILPFDSSTIGTATVSRVITPPTNELFRIEFGVLTNLAARLAAVEASSSAAYAAYDAATNAAAQVVTVYPVATNAAAVSAAAYVTATNAAEIGSAAYVVATNVNGRYITAETATNIAYAVNEVTTIRYAVSNVSDIAGYLVLTNTPSTNAVKTIVVSNPTNGQYVAQFAAEPFGVAGSISEGHIETRAHMSISGGGSLSVVAEPYLIDAAGNKVTEWEGGNVISVPGIDGDGDLFVTPVTAAYAYGATHRRAVKIKVVGKSGAPTLTIAMENGKQLTLSFPVPSSFFASKSELVGYLPITYTNTIPVAGNTLLTLDGTNLTVTGATYAYRAIVTNAYRLGISASAPAFHYGGTIIGTNAVTFADNLLLRGTATVTGTNCFALQPWSNGVWEVLWGGK